MKFLVLFLLFAINSYAFSSSSLKDKSQNNYTTDESKKFYPFNYFEISTDTFFDRINSNSSIYTNSNLLLDINFNEYFTIHTKFGLEKIKGTTFTPDDLKSNTIYDDESLVFGSALTTQELSLLFKFSKAQFHFGKITPSFGVGSSRSNEFFDSSWYGISGTFINDGYALHEKIGLLTNVSVVETDVAKINFQASLFTNDSSDLYTKPSFAEREKNSNRNAGSEKTPKSHSISIQGIFLMENDDTMAFNIGYKNQFSKVDDKSEKGLSIATQYIKYIQQDWSIGVFAEYTQIWNAYALNNFSEKYGTLSLFTSFSGFTIGALTNLYKSTYNNNTDTIRYMEYFAGFHIPKTELSIFLAIKEYKLPESKPRGFGVNIRYKIK